jgi:hypothetical protein
MTMPEFDVNVSETRLYCVPVEAASAKEARDVAVQKLSEAANPGFMFGGKLEGRAIGEVKPKRLAFAYYTIKPAVETDGETVSFLGNVEYVVELGSKAYTPRGARAEALGYMEQYGGKLIWTIYGIDEAGMDHAIGDFETFDIALDVLNAILAPLAKARELIAKNRQIPFDDPAGKAEGQLEDVINQSTNNVRL